MKKIEIKYLLLTALLSAFAIACGSGDDESSEFAGGGVGNGGVNSQSSLQIAKFGYSSYQKVLYWNTTATSGQDGLDFEIQFMDTRSGQWYGLINYVCNSVGTSSYNRYSTGYCSVDAVSPYVESYGFDEVSSGQYSGGGIGYILQGPSWLENLKMRIRACSSVGSSNCGAWRERDFASSSQSTYRY